MVERKDEEERMVSAGPETFSGELDGTQEVIGGPHETDLNGEVSAFFIWALVWLVATSRPRA